MSFITRHLIKKINEQINQKQATLKHDHFYYFDEPIKDKNGLIDRVNKFNPFYKNQILPTTWYQINGTSLHELYSKLKSNKFYIYKKLEDGKSYKTRIKNK